MRRRIDAIRGGGAMHDLQHEERHHDRSGGLLRLLIARRLTRYPARYLEIFRILRVTRCKFDYLLSFSAPPGDCHKKLFDPKGFIVIRGDCPVARLARGHSAEEELEIP